MGPRSPTCVSEQAEQRSGCQGGPPLHEVKRAMWRIQEVVTHLIGKINCGWPNLLHCGGRSVLLAAVLMVKTQLSRAQGRTMRCTVGLWSSQQDCWDGPGQDIPATGAIKWFCAMCRRWIQTTRCKTTPPCDTEKPKGAGGEKKHCPWLHGHRCQHQHAGRGEVSAPQGHYLPGTDISVGGERCFGTGKHLEMQSLLETCWCLATHFSCSIKSVHVLWERQGEGDEELHLHHDGAFGGTEEHCTRCHLLYDHPAWGIGAQYQL